MHGIRVGCLEELELRCGDFFFPFFSRVLTKLDLFQNNIDDGGTEALASAMRVNGVLNTLYIRENFIGAEGAKAIGGALAVNGVLKNIHLSYNNLGDEGEKAIHDAVSGREGFELEM